MRGGVRGEDAARGRRRRSRGRRPRGRAEPRGRRRRSAATTISPAGHEERVEALPGVRDDAACRRRRPRTAARSGSSRRRSCRARVTFRVKRLRGVEGRRARPGGGARSARRWRASRCRPGTAARRRRSGRSGARRAPARASSALQRRLAVGAVGAEIAQVPALGRRRAGGRPPGRPSSRARRAAGRAVVALEPVEGRPAGEGEVEVVAGDQLGREVLAVAARRASPASRACRCRRRRRCRGCACAATQRADGDAVGHVGADDHRVGGRDRRRASASRSREVVVEGESAEVRVGQVAVRAGVPGHVALEEQ